MEFLANSEGTVTLDWFNILISVFLQLVSAKLLLQYESKEVGRVELVAFDMQSVNCEHVFTGEAFGGCAQLLSSINSVLWCVLWFLPKMRSKFVRASLVAVDLSNFFQDFAE